MNDRVTELQVVGLVYQGQSVDRVVFVRESNHSNPGREVVSFMIPGFNEPPESMRLRENVVGDGTTIVYLARRQTAAGEPIDGLTRQTLGEQAEEVAMMIDAFLRMHPDRFKWAVLHGHSMGSVIALRILPEVRETHPEIVWHIIAEAPPPWERAPLWFSNKPFWNNGGRAALRDAVKALTTNGLSGKEGMIVNSDTLFQLYAGGQPDREAFESRYEQAVPDAPLAFMELAFKSGLGDEDDVRQALHEAQLRLDSEEYPVLQIVCFIEDRIFDWSRIVEGMVREARMLTVWAPGVKLIQNADKRRKTGPTVHVDCIASLPHVPDCGVDDNLISNRYLRAVYDCYRRLMF